VKQALRIFGENFFHGPLAQICACPETIGQLALPEAVAMGEVCGGDQKIIIAIARFA